MHRRRHTPSRFPRALGVFAVLLALGDTTADAQPIDRHALVERHNPWADHHTPEAPLSVGNGEFAFTFDITGLQTFPAAEPGHLPLGTMAQWAWHAFPDRLRYRYEQTLHDYEANGRAVSYATDMTTDAARAIRSNPHRFNLGRVALRLLRRDGTHAAVSDLKSPEQTLDLWTGESVSRFVFDGEPVTVRTVAHPGFDAVAVSVESPLVDSGRAAIELSFAYPLGSWGPEVDDWGKPTRHTSQRLEAAAGARIRRGLDETRYTADLVTDAEVVPTDDPHRFLIGSNGSPSVQAVIRFVDGWPEEIETPAFDAVREVSAQHWERFWSDGAAIDLSGSRDPRWRELERRLVLSQYQTALQCAGSMPPQETGLVCNSWHGKSHLEMHWWHAAHFAFWGRFELLEQSLVWYESILPAARRIAERQGYAGVRWPKMTGPRGVSSPSSVGELLIWQQPHPIYYAELAWREEPTRKTLERYHEIVRQTADFMADYAHHDTTTDRYTLGPVLIPAQECYDGLAKPGVLNPTFELAYWRWGLETANRSRERLGLGPNDKWASVAKKIARPHVRDGVYTAIANPPFTRRRDHPSMLAAHGVLPNVGLIDPPTMRRTLLDVQREWDWAETWGWDYPMMAMTAARLGERKMAVDLLLLDTPKNHYLANGHCRQSDRLPIYLPANGGLLTAAAMMAAGWDGAETLGPAPGFPKDGSWTVRSEGLTRMP